jgi:CubicO group peptidase (beta-lactamase class C family)
LTDHQPSIATPLDRAKVRDLLDRAQREIDEGNLPSCQVALARGGELEVFESLGDATDDSRYVVFSCTKAFVAGAMWTLIGDGAVDVRKRVADYIPEFASNGKDVVTVEQVMLHTSGFPHAPLGPPDWFTRQGRVEAFARWRLNWEPGTAYEYHATSAHWVLAEIIERVTDTDYRDVVQRRVTDPAGLPRVLGIPEAEQQGIAAFENRGTPPSPDALEAALGIRELPVTEVTDEALMMITRPENCALGIPGGGGVMRAADLALYYQAIISDDGTIWDPAILADVTGNVRNTFIDPMTGTPTRRTLGLVTAGDDGLAAVRGFGHTTSPRAFGHGGAAGQIAWGDPATGLSFGFCTNGNDLDLLRQWRRGVALSSRAGATVAS